MSGSRDRLGLLLPIPALLAAEPTPAQAQGTEDAVHLGSQSAMGGTEAQARLARSQADPEPPPELGPCLSPLPPDEIEPPDEPAVPPSWTEAPPTDDEMDVRALFGRARDAFARGDHREAATLMEQAAALAPEVVTLRLNTTIMFRLATEAAAGSDAEAMMEMCEGTQRNADAVVAHSDATPEQIERARAEVDAAYEYCQPREVGPCLSPDDDDVGPCLSMIRPGRRGCSVGSDATPAALFGSLMLLGLRSRRRRDAVERLAERLPTDVVDRLRHREDEDPDRGD